LVLLLGLVERLNNFVYVDNWWIGDCLNNEDEETLENALEALTAVYVASLVTNALETQLKASVEALDELNTARKTAGFEPVKMALEDMTAESVKATKIYEKLLREKGGSYIIKDDVKVFSPWLKKLRTDTKQEIIEVFTKARDEGWTAQRVRSELKQIQQLKEEIRAYNAAYCETRVLQDEATRRTWEAGNLEEVEWHTMEDERVRPTHQARNHQVYTLNDCPSLGEPGCRCYISAYITKGARY